MNNFFQYVKSDAVLDSFIQHRNDVLSERRIVIARLGEFSLFLSKVSEEEFALQLENEEDGTLIGGEKFDVTRDDKTKVTASCDRMKAKLQEIHEKEVRVKREQIWKWYIMDWLRLHEITIEEFIDSEMGWSDHHIVKERWSDIEHFLNNEYLDVGNTLHIIELYVINEEDKEAYQKFAANDIVDLIREKNIKAAEKTILEGEEKDKGVKRFIFRVEVTGSNRTEAEERLREIISKEKNMKVFRSGHSGHIGHAGHPKTGGEK